MYRSVEWMHWTPRDTPSSAAGGLVWPFHVLNCNGWAIGGSIDSVDAHLSEVNDRTSTPGWAPYITRALATITRALPTSPRSPESGRHARAHQWLGATQLNTKVAAERAMLDHIERVMEAASGEADPNRRILAMLGARGSHAAAAQIQMNQAKESA